MSYASFLAKTIKESKLSLRAIASLCEKKYNVKITASYLSKLQQDGNKNPASEKVNIAIAKVCEINPEDLIFEADFERAPETVQSLVNEMISFQRNFVIDYLKKGNSKSFNQEIIESEINKIANMSNRELLQYMEMFSNLDEQQNFTEIGIDTNSDNINDILLKFSINIPMLDSSMFPIIPQNAKIELVKLEEYSNGDIVSVQLKDGTTLIRNYVDSGKNIVLIPANRDFETLTLPKNEITINGKVKSYTIDL